MTRAYSTVKYYAALKGLTTAAGGGIVPPRVGLQPLQIGQTAKSWEYQDVSLQAIAHRLALSGSVPWQANAFKMVQFYHFSGSVTHIGLYLESVFR